MHSRDGKYFKNGPIFHKGSSSTDKLLAQQNTSQAELDSGVWLNTCEIVAVKVLCKLNVNQTKISSVVRRILSPTVSLSQRGENMQLEKLVSVLVAKC